MTNWVRQHVLASAVAAAVVVVVLVGWAIAAGRDGSPPVASAPGAAPPASATAASPSPVSPRSPSPSAPPRDCVAATLSGLSLDERAGQVLMVGAPVDGPRTLADEVSRHHLGGVFLAGRSQRRASALRADIEAVQRAADLPLLVALDQEGGSVQTLKGTDFPLIPSAQRLGGGSTAVLRDRTTDTARRLAGIGVTVNLAPVADTVPAAVGERNPPIGFFHRQYGSDPDRVAGDIRTVVIASQRAGVLTTVKHFPGLGRVLTNTDTSTRAADRATTATDPYLEPFAAVSARVPRR